MQKLAVMAVLMVLPMMAPAQAVPIGNVTAQSISGQFLVHGGSASALGFRSPHLTTNANIIFLQPPLLAISCERIKHALWRELGTSAPFKGKVHLYLRTARSGGEPIAVLSERGRGIWSFRVQLPDALERERFVETIVEVLLLEIANRNAREHPAALPPWLSLGLARQIMASSQIDLLVSPPDVRQNGLSVRLINVSSLRFSPLTQAQEVLRTRPPLTFEQLSWLTADQLSGDTAAVFRYSSQLLVNQLLQLKDGRACMRAMLDELPRHHNWQMAFRSAFKAHFPRPLDVEKWWALQLTHFTARDLTQTWSTEESWEKLDQALGVPVQVRTRASDLPMRTTVSLQTIIQEWDAMRRTRVLQAKIEELHAVRLRASQDVVAMVDDYRGVLQGYLQRRERFSMIPFGFTAGFRNRAAEEALRQLNALDARRATLRDAGREPVTAVAEGPAPVR